MQHHLRFFRFNHRTLIPSGKDLTMEEFFAEDTGGSQGGEKLLINDYKSKP
jgi:hypothetical protein